MLACVLVDVHVYEVSCLGRGYLDHACRGVQETQSISEARPDTPEHSIGHQRAVLGFVQLRHTKNLRVRVQGRRQHILPIQAYKELSGMTCWQIQVFGA